MTETDNVTFECPFVTTVIIQYKIWIIAKLYKQTKGHRADRQTTLSAFASYQKNAEKFILNI